jgi:MarR-like DNA-binding transcriptional regulator SgrR of sgrS sRNA
VIVRKKTLEDNHYDLRKVQVYPGTGPFRSVKYTENEVWIMEKNKNYWAKELPYLDGIEFYHEEKTVRRSAGPARDALGARPAGADVGRQGCGANDGRRVPLSVL